MKESGLLFGPRTNLAPGLGLALEGFGARARSGGRVRRTYVLTDGELHDTPECETVLNEFRPRSIEVHVYGFGDAFNAAALKQLVSDQIGGTVKPIANEEDITSTFAHVAEVNRRLVGHNAKLQATFSPEVACGDAWVFQPHGRYLGAIRDRRAEHLIGGIENGRWYSLLLEIRLPTGSGPLGTVEASWVAGDERASNQIEVTAVRKEGAETPVPEVRRAVDVLQVLRAGNDTDAQIASYKARRELAILENRDPDLIAALDKMIAGLANPPAEAKPEDVKPVAPTQRPSKQPLTVLRELKAARERLTERERLLVDSNATSQSMKPSSPEVTCQDEIMKELAEAIELASSEAPRANRCPGWSADRVD
jgi:hypothetical protein